MRGQTCRVCGCTDLDGCPEGCFWVEEDLCSECTPEALLLKLEDGIDTEILDRIEKVLDGRQQFMSRMALEIMTEDELADLLLEGELDRSA